MTLSLTHHEKVKHRRHRYNAKEASPCAIALPPLCKLLTANLNI
ncbi:hypothetical protein ACE1CA_00920 [Aerosakkonemataceae cyanobacterium BLCC-F167]|uniref:Uncharacterized protein n=1 Tax=Floridaenema evergladense BLCC-F167 TaxID=3153639 RepID=A0ABV4WDD6_9CYAN